MSRLYEYMKLSSNSELAKFRSLSFRLVKENTEHKNLLHIIGEEDTQKVLDILSSLNKELKRWYNGNYKFDLCMDEGDTLDVLKIKRKYARSLYISCLDGNDKLSKIKRKVEESMLDNTDIL